MVMDRLADIGARHQNRVPTSLWLRAFPPIPSRWCHTRTSTTERHLIAALGRRRIRGPGPSVARRMSVQDRPAGSGDTRPDSPRAGGPARQTAVGWGASPHGMDPSRRRSAAGENRVRVADMSTAPTFVMASPSRPGSPCASHGGWLHGPERSPPVEARSVPFTRFLTIRLRGSRTS